MHTLVLAALAAASPVLVLDPVGDAVDEEARAALGARVVASLARTGVTAMGQGEVRAMVAAETRRQLVGCDDDSCVAEIAQALGAERAVSSRVARLGDQLIWQVVAIDASAGRVLARSEVRAKDVAGLYAKANAASLPIATALGGKAPLPAFLWPVGLVGAAVLVAGAGVAFDMLSPTSRDGRFDAWDAVGPTAYLVAAGLVLAAFFNPLAEE